MDAGFSYDDVSHYLLEEGQASIDPQKKYTFM